MLILQFFFPGTESWTCQAISDTNDGRCFNPDDGGSYYACQSGNNIDLNKNKFYCEVQPDNSTNSTSWAECSDDCIDPDEGGKKRVLLGCPHFAKS